MFTSSSFVFFKSCIVVCVSVIAVGVLNYKNIDINSNAASAHQTNFKNSANYKNFFTQYTAHIVPAKNGFSQTITDNQNCIQCTMLDVALQDKYFAINKTNSIIKELSTNISVSPKTSRSGYTLTSFSVRRNFYVDAKKSSIDSKTLNTIIDALGSCINFRSEIKPGAMVTILTTKNRKDVLYASIQTKKKLLQMYGYKKIGTSSVEYFTSDARNLSKKNQFMVPINGARISSRFGMRLHPVKKILKHHGGTDFAAPTGTPILASSDGYISFLGNKSGYGKCIILNHSNGYKTLYGHMSAFSKKIKLHSRVHKGNTIGYVGKTGLATGPHLHFEVIRNGMRLNSEKLKFVSGSSLTQADKIKFNKQKAFVNSLLKSMQH